MPVLLGMLSLRQVARRVDVPVTDPAMLRAHPSARGADRPEAVGAAGPQPSAGDPDDLGRPPSGHPPARRCGGWPEERLTTALLHELAHVKRWDFLTQLAARAACAVYWFNPLAWLALARVRREQEQASDDLALGCGLDRHAYADHLLAIVTGRASGGPRSAVAPAMASSAKLERRLLGILDTGRSRRELGPADRRPRRGWPRRPSSCPWRPSTPGRGRGHRQAAGRRRPGGVAPRRRSTQAGRGRIAVESEVLAKVREVFVKPPDESALRKGAIKGMLDALHDPHSAYIDAQQMADMDRNLQGKVTGIGAQLELKDGQVTVVTPLPDSPALKAGLRPGDVIEEVDGQPTRGLELAEVVKRILGKAGEVVRLKVKHADGRAEDLAVTRGVVTIRSVRGFRSPGDAGRDSLLDPDHAIGYVRISQFGTDTAAELRTAIERPQRPGDEGTDPRPPGLPRRAVECGGRGRAVVPRQGDDRHDPRPRRGREVLHGRRQPALAADVPLVVLVDGTTASAGEILAGALKDNDRADHRRVADVRQGLGPVDRQAEGRQRCDPADVRLLPACPAARTSTSGKARPTWGVDPTDGYYVPVDGKTLDAMTRKRVERERVGGPDPAAAAAAKVTPESIERDEADPQLAAALKTMIARTTRGEFVKVGLPLSEQSARLQRLDEARKRRQSLLEDLKKVDKELGELSAISGERP